MHIQGAAGLDDRHDRQTAGDAAPAATSSPKILLYSHDTFGLGNIRRSLVIGELLSTVYARAATLLVTGSPMIQSFPLPSRMDYVKLPCVNRVRAEEYEPRFLHDCAAEVRQTRSSIIEQTALAFRPDLVIVDKRAGGIDGELVPALEALLGLPDPPRVVLGIRDILDAPAVTSATLHRNGSFTLIDRFYDEIWIYGARAVFDAVAEYGFPASVARKSRYVGYLRRRPVRRPPLVGNPRVLVTTGSGEDGEGVVRTFLSGIASLPIGTLRSTIVLGPNCGAEAAERLRRLAGSRADIEIIDFEPDLTRRYEQASAVVAMAGYNTVCELLTAGIPAVLVPRAEPVQEQLIRARRLAARGHVRMVEPAALTPEHLMSALREALAAPPPAMDAIDMDGLSRIRSRVQSLLAGRIA
jgi:predicted glycosyltransferase